MGLSLFTNQVDILYSRSYGIYILTELHAYNTECST